MFFFHKVNHLLTKLVGSIRPSIALVFFPFVRSWTLTPSLSSRSLKKAILRSMIQALGHCSGNNRTRGRGTRARLARSRSSRRKLSRFVTSHFFHLQCTTTAMQWLFHVIPSSVWFSLVISVSDIKFSNQWSVQIDGGKEEADRLARKHGFVNEGKVHVRLYLRHVQEEK